MSALLPDDFDDFDEWDDESSPGVVDGVVPEPLPHVVYAAGDLSPVDAPPVLVHIALALTPARMGPPRLVVVSGAEALQARPEVMGALLTQAWGRLNRLHCNEETES